MTDSSTIAIVGVGEPCDSLGAQQSTLFGLQMACRCQKTASTTLCVAQTCRLQMLWPHAQQGIHMWCADVSMQIAMAVCFTV